MKGKRYPWGDIVNSSQACYEDGSDKPKSVGSYSASGYGLYDMVGNAYEWCAD